MHLVSHFNLVHHYTIQHLLSSTPPPVEIKEPMVSDKPVGAAITEQAHLQKRHVQNLIGIS